MTFWIGLLMWVTAIVVLVFTSDIDSAGVLAIIALIGGHDLMRNHQ